MILRNILCLSILSFSLLATTHKCYEEILVERLDTFTRGKLDRSIIEALNKLADPTITQETLPLPNCGKFPLLFEKFPQLSATIPYISLADLPTPIIHCTKLGEVLGSDTIYIKDDGHSGKKEDGNSLFGGNKVRKLEFLLGEALSYKSKSILTRGGTGTNFGRAAVCYAKQLGMKSTVVLGHQPSSSTVRRNLLLMLSDGAELRVIPNRMCLYATWTSEFLRCKMETGRFPCLIAGGGSCPVGAAGFVNFAFELAQQIQLGMLKEPDYIYAAVGNGSGGTVAGLLLGLQAAGLKSTLVAVHIEPEVVPGEVRVDLKRIYEGTNDRLHLGDGDFPIYPFPEDRLIEIKDFCALEYGLYTKKGVDAARLLHESEHIKLDGTYTSIAFAAMLDYIPKTPKKAAHLFLKSFDSNDYKDITDKQDYRLLPHALQRYFEKPVQDLDF